MKCCVYTRFYFEIIFLDAFIKHYIQLGFDLILVLYHDIQKFEVPECYKNQVKLINVPNYGNYLPDMFRNNIPNDIDWVLHVDSDEFLFIHEKFATIKEFIKSKLKSGDIILFACKKHNSIFNHLIYNSRTKFVGSEYGHGGLILRINNKLYVLECTHHTHVGHPWAK